MRTTPSQGRSRRLAVGRPTGQDVTAGLVTGLFSIPEGMAYASIGGFNPVLGLYSGMAPTLVGSIFARTVLMTTTLTSAIALTSQSVLSQAHLDPKNLANIATLTILVGLVMAVFGLLRLGSAMSFVSNAVMTGFTTGIAVQIIVGVLKDATGYAPHGSNTLVKAGDWLIHPGHWQAAPTFVALATIGVWAATHAIRRLESFATLIALLVVTVVVIVAGVDVETVGDIAAIPNALPHLTAPDLAAVPHLITGAFAVALVALAQAAGIGAAVPNPDGSRTNVSGDFIAQGLANLAGGFTQALPTGGSLSRTGVATSAGARTRWTGIFAGAWLALLVLLLGKQAEHIPMPVIGGLVVVIGVELVVGRWRDIVLVLRTSPVPAIAMVVTFLATTALPLQDAIFIGAGLSLLVFCVQVQHQARLVALSRRPDGHWEVTSPPATLPSAQVTVLGYVGVGLFAEVERIDELWPRVDGAQRAVVVLVMRTVPQVPSSTMVKALTRWAGELHAHGGRLLLAAVEPELVTLLERSGVTRQLGADAVIPATPVLGAALETALESAQRWIVDPGPNSPGTAPGGSTNRPE